MRVLISTLLYSTLMACTPMAEPPPLLSAAPSTPGRDAFYAGLKAGDYSSLEDTIEGLTREMLEGDDISTATLGFAHAWRLAEASRLEEGLRPSH